MPGVKRDSTEHNQLRPLGITNCPSASQAGYSELQSTLWLETGWVMWQKTMASERPMEQLCLDTMH